MTQTGYYARAHENGHTAKWTSVHLVKDSKPICGYKPHKTMQFVWNSNGARIDYVDCPTCRKKYLAEKVKELDELNKKSHFAKEAEKDKKISLIRCFRLKCRILSSNRVSNQRDYIGLENLLKHGNETYLRYDRPDSKYSPCRAELYEKIDGKWKKLKYEEIYKLMIHGK